MASVEDSNKMCTLALARLVKSVLLPGFDPYIATGHGRNGLVTWRSCAGSNKNESKHSTMPTWLASARCADDLSVASYRHG